MKRERLRHLRLANGTTIGPWLTSSKEAARECAVRALGRKRLPWGSEIVDVEPRPVKLNGRKFRVSKAAKIERLPRSCDICGKPGAVLCGLVTDETLRQLCPKHFSEWWGK